MQIELELGYTLGIGEACGVRGLAPAFPSLLLLHASPKPKRCCGGT